MYGRSQTFSIVKWVDFIAKSVRQEADWHVGTIAVTDYWNSVHFSFCSFTVDGVSFFTDGHFNSGVAVNNGNNIVSVFNFSAEGFSENTYRNHGSPSIVDVWSAEFVNGTVEDFVVDQVLFRTDGHNDVTTVSCSFITEGVGEGSGINFAVGSLYSNNNVSSASSVAFEVETTNTVSYSFVSLEFYSSFFVALGFNISGNSTVYFGNLAIFVNNGDFYSVVFTDRTLYRIECESFIAIVGNDSQFFFGVDLVHFVISGDGDHTADDRLVSRGVVEGLEAEWVVQVNSLHVNSCALYANAEVGSRSNNFQALFINEVYSTANILTKSYLIVDSGDGIVVCIVNEEAIVVSSDQINCEAFSALEFSEGESSSCINAIVQGNRNGVFTRDEIMNWVITYILESVSAIVPSENDIVISQLRIVWSIYFNEISMVGCILVSSNYESEHFVASSVAVISILDVELYGIVEVCVLIVNILIVGTSEHDAAILSGGNAYRCHSVLYDFQICINLIGRFADGDVTNASVGNFETEFKVTFSISLDFLINERQVVVLSGDSQSFVFSSNSFGTIQSICSTSNGVFFLTVRGNIVVDGVSPVGNITSSVGVYIFYRCIKSNGCGFKRLWCYGNIEWTQFMNVSNFESSTTDTGIKLVGTIYGEGNFSSVAVFGCSYFVYASWIFGSISNVDDINDVLAILSPNVESLISTEYCGLAIGIKQIKFNSFLVASVYAEISNRVVDKDSVASGSWKTNNGYIRCSSTTISNVSSICFSITIQSGPNYRPSTAVSSEFNGNCMVTAWQPFKSKYGIICTWIYTCVSKNVNIICCTTCDSSVSISTTNINFYQSFSKIACSSSSICLI